MKRSRRRLLLWATAVAMLLTGVLARHPGVIIAQTATPKYGGTFVYSLGGEPAHLNPAITLSVLENQVGAAIFDVLVELNQELVPVPSLAESWKISPDGLRYEFTLVDTRWHDGKPVTSEDVKFTFEEALLKAHPRGAAQRDRIKSIETPSPRTVVFNLEAPFAPLLALLAVDARIIPKHIYSGGDIRNHPANFKPIGSGPFRFVEWVKGSHVIVERNPNYFKPGKPYVDRIVYKITPDSSSRVLALESGDVHYVSYYVLPSAEVERLRKNPDIVVSDKGAESALGLLAMVINTQHPILGKKEVRQAIYYAIDRRVVNEKADFNLGKVAAGPIPSAWKWAYNPEVAQKYPHNLARAAQLLDQAGLPKKADGIRFPVRMIVDRGIPLYVKGSEVVAQQLRDVGIAVQLQPVDRPTLLDRMYTKWDFDLNVHGFAAGPDPAIGVSRLYISDNRTHAPFSNASGYGNPKADELFKQAARTPRLEDRGRFYKEVQSILVEDVPLVWLTEYGTVSAWRKEMAGLHSWSADSMYAAPADVWWPKGREKP
jgi:peptide/nickel transport system substrate-binding protein